METRRNYVCLFIFCWLIADSKCRRDFCPSEDEPVVQVCQTDNAEKIDEVYVNSGRVPIRQVMKDCKCTIKASPDTMFTIEIVDHDYLQPDMTFYVDGKELSPRETQNINSDFIVLSYSKLEEISVGGGCVRIFSDDDDKLFSITCEAKTSTTTSTTTTSSKTTVTTTSSKTTETTSSKTTETTSSKMSFIGSSEDGDDSDKSAVIGAVVGSLVLVSIIVVVVVIIFYMKRRRSREQENTINSGNVNKTKDYDVTYDEYGMQLNPGYESSEVNQNNQTIKTSSLDENQYDMVEGKKNSSEGQSSSTNYDYAECRSPSNVPATNKTVQNQNEDTYDHTTTTTTSAGSNSETQNVYNHLSPSFSQQPGVDEYNTVGEVNTNKTQNISDNDYNVLKLP